MFVAMSANPICIVVSESEPQKNTNNKKKKASQHVRMGGMPIKNHLDIFSPFFYFLPLIIIVHISN